ncbi:DUF2892 domain-containing protein, partial [bacterium]
FTAGEIFMTPEEFHHRIASPSRPLLVYFWAPWCIPCRAMSPHIQDMAAQFDGRVDLIKINADEAPELVHSLNILSIPTLLAYANGELLFRRSGSQNPAALRQIFSAAAGTHTPTAALKPTDRILRAAAGTVLGLLGLSLSGGPNFLLLMAGGVLLFSAIYDRCPIYRAVSARVRAVVRRRSGQ